jgi:hypothetical protein
MIGWLIVQPNAAYVPPSSTTTSVTPNLMLNDAKVGILDLSVS